MTTFRTELAGNMRDARLASGMTQSELAQQIGVTMNCISQYENAKRMPNLETMSCISHVLDVSLDDVVPEVICMTTVDPCQTDIFDLIGENDE